MTIAGTATPESQVNKANSEGDKACEIPRSTPVKTKNIVEMKLKKWDLLCVRAISEAEKSSEQLQRIDFGVLIVEFCD